MRVEQVMTKKVQTCTPHESLERAAQLMWNFDCGGLPVCQAGDSMQVIGFITDRDIAMSAMFQQKPLRDLRIADAMAKKLKAVHPGDSLADAEKIMSSERVRRLPVVDKNGSLVGLIALADLAQEAMRETKGNVREVTEKEVGSTLAAICHPTKARKAA